MQENSCCTSTQCKLEGSSSHTQQSALGEFEQRHGYLLVAVTAAVCSSARCISGNWLNHARMFCQHAAVLLQLSACIHRGHIVHPVRVDYRLSALAASCIARMSSWAWLRQSVCRMLARPIYLVRPVKLNAADECFLAHTAFPGHCQEPGHA